MPTPKRVMVIDDDPDFLSYVGIVLDVGGYVVDTALNMAEGLRKIRETPPDLVIVDVMLSCAFAGWSISRELENDSRLCRVPILMVSAIVSMQDDDLFPVEQRDLASAFLSKPIEPAALLERVSDLL